MAPLAEWELSPQVPPPLMMNTVYGMNQVHFLFFI
jgi:hypothetical protein